MSGKKDINAEFNETELSKRVKTNQLGFRGDLKGDCDFSTLFHCDSVPNRLYIKQQHSGFKKNSLEHKSAGLPPSHSPSYHDFFTLPVWEKVQNLTTDKGFSWTNHISHT